MVVGFKHMWIAITSNLIAIMFVMVLLTVVKIWMFSSPKKERIIPAYSLHVMKNLPPDKPVAYQSRPNPYAKSSGRSNPYSHRIKPSYSQASQAREARGQGHSGHSGYSSGARTPQYRYPGQPANYGMGAPMPQHNYPAPQSRFV